VEASEVVVPPHERARDPLTPTKELIELAALHPAELAANPILPLLALEDPAAWAQIMIEVRMAEIGELVLYGVPRYTFKRMVCWGQGPLAMVPRLWWNRNFECGYGLFFHAVFVKNFEMMNTPRKRMADIAIHYPARPVTTSEEAMVGARCVNHYREILKHGKTTSEAMKAAVVDSFRCLAMVRGFFEMEAQRVSLQALLLTG